MRVGMYLAYSPPNKKMSLKQEGLGRYIAELMRAFINNGDEITIACPNWVIDSIEELLEEFAIDKSKVMYLVPKGEPILYQLYLYKVLKTKKPKKQKLIEKIAITFLDKMFTFVLSIRNTVVFILLLLLALFIGILLLPIALLGIVLLAAMKVLQKINSKFLKINTNIVFRPHEILIDKVKSARFLKPCLKYIQANYNPMMIQEKIRLSSAHEIIRHINNSMTPTDIWYCPMSFWPEFNNIKTTKVICVPDVVTREFPENFSKYDSSEATAKVRKTICGGTYFITYCNYIKETLVEQYFGKESANIIAIKHAINETLPYIDIKGAFVKKMNVEDVVLRFARTLLPGLIDKNVNMLAYLGGKSFRFGFDSVRYIFYPSQIRGNKNILTLVKAYQYLLRERHCAIKLFLTCNYPVDKELMDYIMENRLQMDVLSFVQVTNQQLAAMYKCAELVVNPTLYEGGFPFTFGEGLSVGTPSVMSSIPQVLEEVSGYELDEMLFNPYDYRDVAEKIIYGLNHRDELIQKEMVLYKQMQNRNWDVVGKEYVKAFTYFLEKSRGSENVKKNCSVC